MRSVSQEVRPQATRRQFSATYKRQIVEEAGRLSPQERGSLLRREGLQSWHLTRWQAELRAGGIEQKQRGPKANPALAELRRLERENARLMAKLKQAELIIAAHKKLAEILDTTTTPPTEEEMLERSERRDERR